MPVDRFTLTKLPMATFSERFQAGLAEAKQQRAHPESVSPKQQKKTHRAAGAILLVLGAGLTLANILSYQATGRVLIIAVAANILFPIAGLVMLITGKNFFKLFKR